MSDNKKSKRTDAVTDKNNELQAADSKKGEVTKKAESKKKEEQTSGGSFLWILSFILLAVAIGGNYYYTRYIMIEESSLERLTRVIIVIAVIVAALGCTLFTGRGKKIISFARESYVELRKVIWPTRQEALQTTFIVFIAVCVVSLFLYLADLIFLQIVRLITL